jgi:ribosomal protein S12 methylthiotransferase accessory factor
MPGTLTYSSSLRAVPVEQTLQRARSIARTLGITRVTDTTRLDRIGVPVFASIRPSAAPGSLCVNAGKGLTPNEARVGAYMEAIEFAWAEYNRAQLPVIRARVRDVLDGAQRRLAILDFCPVWGTTLDLDAQMDCVPAHDLQTGATTLVPAELVFHPLPTTLGGALYFGTGSNGLCSGNTVEEATLHGLAEVLERDIISFHKIRDRSRLVRPETLPATLRALHEHLQHLGFEHFIRFQPNPFGLPCFTAVVSDLAARELTLRGDACHASASIAATRAICETIQCRLTLIHGARDDLVNVFRQTPGLSAEEKHELFRRVLEPLARDADAVSFSELPDFSAAARDIPAATQVLLEALLRGGIARVLRVVYTPADYPVQVVRVLVPGLECYAKDTRRIGPRLRSYVKS